MRLWRISKSANLDGMGGLRASARWHSQGHRIVYLADHPSAALLEVLVHLEIDWRDIPENYLLLTVDVPDGLAQATVAPDDLPTGWRDEIGTTRGFGDLWLAAETTALMRVPSAIVPFTSNWLLNPTHPDAGKCKIIEATAMPFDQRLIQKR